MKKAVDFIKNDPVLAASGLLALVSLFIVPPSKEYIGYIDYKVLAVLFCLMAIIASLQKLGFFAYMGQALTAKTSGFKSLRLTLVMLCFFSSMLITNDVALITFVPFTITVFGLLKLNDRLIYTVVLETVAANLGSMLTPTGNPQNLYLYSLSGMTIPEFVTLMLPPAAVSLVLLIIACLAGKSVPIDSADFSQKSCFTFKSPRFWLYTALFALCLLNIMRIAPLSLMLGAVVLYLLIFDRDIFKKVDYSLLITFVFFFVFIGNMGSIEAIKNFLSSVIAGREIVTGAVVSQVISNVPAAMLLSGFTDNYRGLLYGVNIGGLGTLIASMASLISYKLYSALPFSQKGKYIKCFTAVNVIMLIILLIFALVI